MVNKLTKNEVITLLSACRSLSKRLLDEGINTKLGSEDHEALLGFNKVWLDGWLDNNNTSNIHLLAGLNLSEIGLLSLRLRKDQLDEMPKRSGSGGTDEQVN